MGTPVSQFRDRSKSSKITQSLNLTIPRGARNSLNDTIPRVDTSADDDVYANYNDMGPKDIIPKYGRGGPAIAPETIAVPETTAPETIGPNETTRISSIGSRISSASSSSRGRTSKISSTSSRGSSTSRSSISSRGSSSSGINPVKLMPRAAPVAGHMNQGKSAVMSEAFVMKSYYYPSDDSPNSINGTFVIDFNSISLEQLQNPKQKGGARVCSEEHLDPVGPNMPHNPTLADVTRRYQLDRTPIGTMSAMYECMALSAAMEVVSYDQANLRAAQAALDSAQAALDAAQAALAAAVLPVPNPNKPNPKRRGIAGYLLHTNRAAFSREAATIIATQLGGTPDVIIVITNILIDHVGATAAGAVVVPNAAAAAAYNGVFPAARQFDLDQAIVVARQAAVDAAAADPLAFAAGVTLNKTTEKFGRTLVHGNLGYGRGGINPADTNVATAAIRAINNAAPPAVGPSNFESIWINFKTNIANWIGVNAVNKLVNFIWDDEDKQFIIQIFDIPIAPTFTPIGPGNANCFMITRQLKQTDLSHITMHRPRVKANKWKEFTGASSRAGPVAADGSVAGGIVGPIHVQKNKAPKLAIGTTWVLCADFNCAAGPGALANTTYEIRNLNRVVVRRDVSIPGAQPLVQRFFEGLMKCFAQQFIEHASLTAHPQYILNNPQLDPVLKTELTPKLINACVSEIGGAALWPGYLTRAQMPLNTLCMVTRIGDATNAPSTYPAWVTGFTNAAPPFEHYVQPTNQAAAAILNPTQFEIVVAQPGAVNSNALVKAPTMAELANIILFPRPNFVAGDFCMSRNFSGTLYDFPVEWFHARIVQVNGSTVNVNIFPNAPMGLVLPALPAALPGARRGRAAAPAAAPALAAAIVGVKPLTVSIYAIKPCNVAQAAIALQLATAAGI